jgi:AcrR family transcriptional regulator
MKSTPPSRRYSSPSRTEQARVTKQRVLEAAKALFLAHGFAKTTIVAVAAAAGVSPETIYATFDGKRALLEGVIDTTIMGPQAPIPLEAQAEWDRIAAQPTARARLRAYVAFSCGVLARTSAVHHVIRGAADSEPFAEELCARLLRERLASNTQRLRAYVGTELRAGLDLRRAAERYCALSSPEMHHLLTVKIGWSSRHYADWLAEVTELDLLGAPE